MEVYPQSDLSNTFLPMQYTDVFYRSKNRKILLEKKNLFFFFFSKFLLKTYIVGTC